MHILCYSTLKNQIYRYQHHPVLTIFPSSRYHTSPANFLINSLSWDENTKDDINGYNVYRCLTSGIGYGKVNSYTGGNLTISLWYKTSSLLSGNVVVNLDNGTSYVQLRTFTGTVSWTRFSQIFTYSGTPQYFINIFRLQFVSAIGSGNKSFYLDDMVIAINH